MVKEPDCDRTSLNHKCRDVCADDVQMDDHEEDENPREPDAPADDGQAGGQPSDEDVDANKG